MTTNVLLIRHGQTDPNIQNIYAGRSDEDLNDTGYTQARRLSSRLAGLPFSAVFTSPLRRTCTTASILAEPHHLEPRVSDDLNEIRLGDWEGLQMDEVKRRWPELWLQSRTDPSEITLPNGESFRQVTERAVEAFKTIVEANHSGDIAIVTHDIIIRVLVAYVLGVSNSIYRKIEIQNTSLSMIRVADGKAQLVTLNDTSHLQD